MLEKQRIAESLGPGKYDVTANKSTMAVKGGVIGRAKTGRDVSEPDGMFVRPFCASIEPARIFVHSILLIEDRLVASVCRCERRTRWNIIGGGSPFGMSVPAHIE